MQSWVPNTGLQIQPQGLIRRRLLCMRLWDRDAAAINDAHVFMFEAMLFMQGLWCHIECLQMPYGIFEQRIGMLSTHTGVAISWDWTDIIAKDEQGVSERVNVRKVNAVNAHTRRTESEAWAHEATVRAAG